MPLYICASFAVILMNDILSRRTALALVLSSSFLYSTSVMTLGPLWDRVLRVAAIPVLDALYCLELSVLGSPSVSFKERLLESDVEGVEGG